MKKAADASVLDDGMRPEYDFTGGVRGKYYENFHRGSNVVVLDPDVSKVFPDSSSVNRALRTLASRRAASAKRRSKAATKRPNKRMQLKRSATAKRRGPRS